MKFRRQIGVCPQNSALLLLLLSLISKRSEDVLIHITSLSANCCLGVAGRCNTEPRSGPFMARNADRGVHPNQSQNLGYQSLCTDLPQMLMKIDCITVITCSQWLSVSLFSTAPVMALGSTARALFGWLLPAPKCRAGFTARASRCGSGSGARPGANFNVLWPDVAWGTVRLVVPTHQ